MRDLDCLIIGAGPAGQQAGLFLGRAGVKTLIVGDPARSDLASGRSIENYFGASEPMPGATLLENGVAHLRRFGVEVVREEAVDIAAGQGSFTVRTDRLHEFSAKAVIIASGQQLPTAGIRGEREWLGKGVHTCVACDGPFFRKKRVAVVGNGPHAAEEAVEIAQYAASVTVHSQGLAWEIGEAFMGKLKEKGVSLADSRIVAVDGDTQVRRAELADGSTVDIDGVFIATGSAGGVTFGFKLGLELDGDFVKIDRDGRTSLPGVWAAGGVTGGNPQIAKSVGEGCNAAISVIRALKGMARYVDQT